MAKRSDYLVGLDIGTTEVRCAVGLVPTKDGDNIQILGIGVAQNDGLSKGVISQMAEVVEATAAAIEQAEAMIGQKIKAVTVNINGAHIYGQTSRDDVGVSNVDRRVVDQDIRLVADKVKSGRIKINEALIQFFPREYRLDEQRSIKNPLDLNGRVLGLEALLVKGLKTHVEAVERTCSSLNIKINNRTVSSLGAWEAVFEKQAGNSGVSVLDVGAATTNLIIVRDGEIEQIAVIPIGGRQLTNDLAIGLKIDLNLAEMIKTEHIDVGLKPKGTKTITIDEGELVFNQAVATKVIRDRLQELADKINAIFEQAGCQQQLPGGVLLTGGTSALPGITELLSKELGLSVRLGQLRDFDGLINEVNKNRSYLTAVGLMALDFVLGQANQPSPWEIWRGRYQRFVDWSGKLIKKAKNLRN